MQGPFTIRKPIARQWRIILGLAAWLVFVALWFGATRSRLLPALAVPDPVSVIKAFGRLWTEYDLLGNVFQSWWRIAQAFLWSAVVAIPLGLLMGSFPWLYHFVAPVAAPMRSMPITAFLPAFIALFGLDEAMKVSFLVFGMFFFLLAVVVDETNKVDDALLETAYTLGAKTPHALWLLFRASFPPVFASFRILYDIGWTYVILAEMVNSRKGVGYMVEAARKVLDFDRVYAGIIAIGVAAFLFRWLLASAEKWLFPWQLPSSPQSEAPPVASTRKAPTLQPGS
jgi:NitT/TauT family transport system permease protein